jgi:hypothetical protein
MSENYNEIKEPLEPWVERIIDSALAKHRMDCPVLERVTRLEIRFAALVGWMIGSGLVGGFAGGFLSKIFV